MTHYSQSHNVGAEGPNRLLTPRTTTKLGTWNVRTMFEAGRAQQIANEMSRFKTSLLGISETRWIKSGRFPLASGQTILFSGHEDDHGRHTHRVGFMLSAETTKPLMEWELINARLIAARFYGTPTNISIIQGYAPTNDAEPEGKAEFYDILQSTIDTIPKRDLVIIMGDFDGKISSDNTGREQVMGGHGEGEINANGELFVDMCAFNSMVIGGSIFPNKRIHKVTWVSPDHHTESQIDHICINKRFRRSVQDVRVYKGADVASDHYSVVGTLRLKLKKYNTRSPRVTPRYNTKLLQDPPILRASRLHLVTGTRFWRI